MTRQPPIDRVTWIVVGLVFGFAMIRGVIPALVRGERVGLALLALGSMVIAVVLPRVVACMRRAQPDDAASRRR